MEGCPCRAIAAIGDLCKCDFIRSYSSIGKSSKDVVYQLTDLFSLFHLRFVSGTSGQDERYRQNIHGQGVQTSWAGYAFEQVCLHHIRQIKERLGIVGVLSNVYAWACKPFDMNSGDIIDAFGSGTLVSKYVGAKEGGDANTVYFEQTPSIEKGKLYIIKPTTAEPDNNNITVASTKDESIKLTGKYYTIPNIVYGSRNENEKFEAKVTDNTADLYTGASQYTFAGTYVKTQGTIPAYSYLLKASSDDDHTGSSSKWYYRTKASSSRGFRGWLQPATEGNNAAKLTFVINGIEDGTTAIDGIAADTVKAQDGRIYNVAGQQVSGKLAKGLYIQNGKKFIVK